MQPQRDSCRMETSADSSNRKCRDVSCEIVYLPIRETAHVIFGWSFLSSPEAHIFIHDASKVAIFLQHHGEKALFQDIWRWMELMRDWLTLTGEVTITSRGWSELVVGDSRYAAKKTGVLSQKTSRTAEMREDGEQGWEQNQRADSHLPVTLCPSKTGGTGICFLGFSVWSNWRSWPSFWPMTSCLPLGLQHTANATTDN